MPDNDPIVKRYSKTGGSYQTMRKSQADRFDREERREKIVSGIITALVFLVIAAIAIGISWLVTGGNVRCMFSQDPALCAAVSEVDR